MGTGFLCDAAYIRHVSSPYNTSQVKAYLRKIQWPGDLAEAEAIEPNLDNLRTVMILHALAFPIDNTDLHYTPEHHMPVTPQELYERMVLGGKGSYCFGQNSLMLGILRGLGYRVYPAAGRVLVPSRQPSSPAGAVEYTPFSHLVLLVQPHQAPHANATYLVDVGFGGTGPVRPILLADGGTDVPQRVDDTGGSGEWSGGWVWGSYPPERHRVVRGAYAGSSLEVHPNSGRAPLRDWHLQVSHSTPFSWKTLYTFTETEFFRWDVEAASFAVSHLPGQIFNATIVCVRLFEVPLEAGDDDKVETEDLVWMGKWTLEAGRATRRVGARVVEERAFGSERERLEVIRDVFGLAVSVDDARWIEGRPAAL
ncbi:cysteine proteinase [Amylostereum chailletii]|nr:cysteine proteinase [Amylostereum chailletii]